MSKQNLVTWLHLDSRKAEQCSHLAEHIAAQRQQGSTTKKEWKFMPCMQKFLIGN